MKQKRVCVLSLLVLGALAAIAIAVADDGGGQRSSAYKLLTTISIPGGLVGFDISWVDSQAGRYYLADRGTGTTPAMPRIDVIDTERRSYLYSIPLSTAPNGVVAIHRTGDEEEDRGTLVVGGTDSTAIFIDLAHPFATPLTVNTGGKGRADELAYDPQDHVILIANDRDVDLFVTFVSTTSSPRVLGSISYAGPGNPKSTGGIEQPVWNGVTKKFYLAIPATQANSNGEVDEIDPVAMKITRAFPTTCGPAGLVLIPGQHLMTSCGDVITIADGSMAHTAGVGGDEIWFNQGDDRVYFGGSLDRISVPVVSALSPFNLLTTVVAGQILTPPAPNHTTHSVAADSQNNQIFVPVSYEGVKVYAAGGDNEGEDDQFTAHDAKFFRIYSGVHQGKWTRCADCHPSEDNRAVFTCIACHQHSNQAQVTAIHAGVRAFIYNATSCYMCHPKV